MVTIPNILGAAVGSGIQMSFPLKLVCVVAFFATFDAVAQRDCELKLNRDSIKVFTCIRENSKFKSVRATFELQGSLPQLAAMMLDIEHLGDWQYKTLSAKVLKRISAREVIYYTEVAAPIFTSNRDFVIHLTLNQDPQTHVLTVDLVSIPNYIPPKEGVVRVPFSKARLSVTPISTSRLSAEYSIEIDLGGAVPAWLVNMVAPQAPYETFKALRAQVTKYKGRVSFVTE